MANTVPNIIYILLAGGVLNAVFVPQLVRAMKEGPERSRAYSDRLLTLAGLVLLGVSVVATAAAPLVIDLYGRRLTPEDAHVATLFAFWCLPQIFFYGLYTMLGQVLTARNSFGPMMWAPVLNNLVAIATGLVFIGVYTVDELDPSSLPTGAIALPGRRHHPGCRRCRRWSWCRCCAGVASAGDLASTSAASAWARPGTWPSGPCCSCWSTSSPTS